MGTIAPVCNHQIYKWIICILTCYITAFLQLIISFANCSPLICRYHYLTSDHDFQICCDKTVVFEVECTCLHEMVVFEYLRQKKWMQLQSIVHSNFTFQNVFFFLEIKLSCGHGPSATKIKTADIERIMCATVVTSKRKHTVGGRKISFGRLMCTPVIRINLHNLIMYQKQRLFSFNYKCLQRLIMWSI